jgi:hypothetical protein
LTTALKKAVKYRLVKDPFDARDLIYRGNLQELPSKINHSKRVNFQICQGDLGACTGFGLANAINIMTAAKTPQDGAAPRFLYEKAKEYDVWAGKNYEGSSPRGAIKGFFNHGCPREKFCPYDDTDDRDFEIPEQAIKDAVNLQLGCYFRIPTDNSPHVYIQAALMEVPVVYASVAETHSGWDNPEPKTGVIPYKKNYKKDGGHAFCIVGYDDIGFLILNSWEDWGITLGGVNGFGRITYEDWKVNAGDAWALRIAPKTRFLINL